MTFQPSSVSAPRQQKPIRGSGADTSSEAHCSTTSRSISCSSSRGGSAPRPPSFWGPRRRRAPRRTLAETRRSSSSCCMAAGPARAPGEEKLHKHTLLELRAEFLDPPRWTPPFLARGARQRRRPKRRQEGAAQIRDLCTELRQFLFTAEASPQ
ncbi:unnamed protein product, partial [Prorocentrum cordatum]